MASTDPSKTSSTPAAPAAADSDEVARLRQENARLRTELANAREGKPADRQEFVPAWIPAGTQADLDMTGRAVNPFNGERLGDWSDVDEAEARRTGTAPSASTASKGKSNT